jgi:hypothetical protein
MEINKEYLGEKLKQLADQRNKIVEQMNEGVVIVNRIDGAIDTIKLLLKDIDKVEDNKE